MRSSHILPSLLCILLPFWANAQFSFGNGGSRGDASNFFSPSFRTHYSPYKGYSGFVWSKDNLRVVYNFDQTFVVVEVGPNKKLENCEIIEVYEENDTLDAMNTLSREVGKPFEIDMDKMVKLMEQCQSLAPRSKSKFEVNPKKTKLRRAEAQTTSSYPLFNGIIPGTKWCGTGDIADTYYDMGTEIRVDKCCRTHDLCPSKIRGNTSRYNITNNSIFTKSHCTCDKNFRSCLKSTKSAGADLMGEFYFNIFRVPCIIDTPSGKKFKLPQNY